MVHVAFAASGKVVQELYATSASSSAGLDLDCWCRRYCCCLDFCDEKPEGLSLSQVVCASSVAKLAPRPSPPIKPSARGFSHTPRY